MITITQDNKIIAHMTTSSPRSHYGQPVWVIEESNPQPGPALWQQGKIQFTIDILSVIDGWLVVRQPDGFLSGIIWSDGTYYADLILDDNGDPVTELSDGCRVSGTVPMGEMGSIF